MDKRRALTSLIVAGRTIVRGQIVDFDDRWYGRLVRELVKAEWFERDATVGAANERPYTDESSRVLDVSEEREGD